MFSGPDAQLWTWYLGHSVIASSLLTYTLSPVSSSPLGSSAVICVHVTLTSLQLGCVLRSEPSPYVTSRVRPSSCSESGGDGLPP